MLVDNDDPNTLDTRIMEGIVALVDDYKGRLLFLQDASRKEELAGTTVDKILYLIEPTVAEDLDALEEDDES